MTVGEQTFQVDWRRGLENGLDVVLMVVSRAQVIEKPTACSYSYSKHPKEVHSALDLPSMQSLCQLAPGQKAENLVDETIRIPVSRCMGLTTIDQTSEA